MLVFACLPDGITHPSRQCLKLTLPFESSFSSFLSNLNVLLHVAFEDFVKRSEESLETIAIDGSKL